MLLFLFCAFVTGRKLNEYLALVVEIVPYEKCTDGHSHLLVGPFHASVPTVPGGQNKEEIRKKV